MRPCPTRHSPTICLLLALTVSLAEGALARAQAATLLDERGLRSVERLFDIRGTLERDSSPPTFQTFDFGAFGGGGQVIITGLVRPDETAVFLWGAKDGRPLTSDEFGGKGGDFAPNTASAGSSGLIEFIFERFAPEPGLLYATLTPLEGTDFGPGPLDFAEAADFTVPVQITLDLVAEVPLPASLGFLIAAMAAIRVLAPSRPGRG
ncbi:MAG: hypothetical protein AAF371_15280 [Pseudomonadota bacterium]